MHIDSLIRMANQIGTFFEAMPDHDEAVEGIAQHLKKFWDPRMRQELLTALDGAPQSGLSPIVVEALRMHHGLLG